MKRVILKTMTALVVGMMLVTCLMFDTQVRAQETKDSLIQRIESYANGSVKESYYTDFDGDGSNELFATIGDDEVWFANESMVKQIYGHDAALYESTGEISKVSAKQKLMSFETEGYGSSSQSLCYYVKNGKPIRVAKAGEGLTHSHGKDFVVYMSAIDSRKINGSGLIHTLKPYYIKWNGMKFVEYKGTRISQRAFKKYKNASGYLNKAKKLGYKIGTLFYRKNGIINVNLLKGANRQNLTFKVKGKKVTLQVNDKNGKNIVRKSSYGGVYKASGFC